ncbi:MAG: adenosine deaminase [Sphingobium sp.]
MMRKGLPLLLAALLAAPAIAQTTGEAATAALFDKVAASPARLRVFLQDMPKGGDLHNHLWGQPYAEQFLDWAGEAGLCVSEETLSIVAGPCKGDTLVPAKDLIRRKGGEALYVKMIRALSTRDRNVGLGVNDTTGHDDFFETFDRFAASAIAAPGAMLASARTSAATNHVSYLELMQDPGAIMAAGGAAAKEPFDPADFEGALQRLSPQIPALAAAARTEIDAMEADAVKRLGCATTPASPPCAVTVRYQFYALRSAPPAFVFGQLAAAFAVADADPRVVGVNIVAPEDGAVAIADFDLHMAMFRFFSARYPRVKKSMHAGELAMGLVPPAALDNHIRRSIEVAGATRIGHGVAIAHEKDAPALLARMAKDRIAVEINLTSNDTILGVKGAAHPLALYRAAGVPVVLSTDDEGVSRSDMTNEYLRAATEQGLRYTELKGIARASLQYAFLPGPSLWADGKVGTRVTACANPAAPSCTGLLASSEKAKAQWRLETEFQAFESKIGRAVF